MFKGFQKPKRLVANTETLTERFGQFTAQPFERGFGVTIGNSLRRILLSSLEGSAVTQIKIHGAQHEFTTIKGVLEDITDVVLNVKSMVVKNHSETTRVLRVEKTTAGPILAGDIDCGFLFMHQAFEEDRLTTGTPRPDLPAWRFTSLDFLSLEQFFRPRVRRDSAWRRPAVERDRVGLPEA